MKPLLYLLLLIATASCSTGDALTDAEKSPIRAEVAATMQNYFHDISVAGLSAEFKYLDSSADFFWVPPGHTAALSYDSVRTIITQNAPKFRSVTNTFDSLRIIPLTHNLASYYCRVHSAMTDTAGAENKFSLIESGIVIKRSAGWKLLSGQTAMISTSVQP